jgi:ElaB/YqjD/DUF883 family membrane-anchored ribosome-binding protein
MRGYAGKYPISFSPPRANALLMRDTATGNAHHVDVEQLLEDIKLVVRDGQELLRARFGSFKEQARDCAQSTQKFVYQKPYQTIGIAFGVGVLIGLLAAASRSRGTDQEEED